MSTYPTRNLSKAQWQRAWRIVRERAPACPSDEQIRVFGLPSVALQVWIEREQMRYQESQLALPVWLRVAYERAVQQIDQRFA